MYVIILFVSVAVLFNWNCSWSSTAGNLLKGLWAVVAWTVHGYQEYLGKRE